MQQKFLFLFLFLVGFVNGQQVCSSARPFKPQTCLFSGNLTGEIGGAYSTQCYYTNLNPVSLTPVVVSNNHLCSDKVYQNGNECIELYSKLMCSYNCVSCNQRICSIFCDSIPSICPEAFQAGCLGRLDYCHYDNNNCTNWNIDKFLIPKI